jgi:hypothetical protein
MQRFIIREYREGDEVQINQLFNEVFGSTRSLDEWRWKFKQNPTKGLVIAVAESAGRVVGQYADVPVFMKYLERTVPVAIPVDNVIHPHFRGGISGVQKSLNDFSHSLWRHVLAYGFPTDAARTIGKRILKYRDLGKMPVLFKRLNFRQPVGSHMPWMPRFALAAIHSASIFFFKFALKARIWPGASAVRVTRVDSCDERFDTLWDRAKAKHKLICIRDQRFLNWRYSKPGTDYRIAIAERSGEPVGYVVTGVKREAGVVAGYLIDLLTDDSRGACAALVRHALLDLLSRNADYALCWMLPDKLAFQVLRQFGFARRENAFPSANIVFKLLDPQAIDEQVVSHLPNWYLTMADSDVF